MHQLWQHWNEELAKIRRMSWRERESSARTHSQIINLRVVGKKTQIAPSGRSSAIKEAANIEFFISTSGLESYIWKGDIRLNIL